MKDDLLILKLLKIPVTIIKILCKAIAMLTYLPNYLIILLFDSVIFHPKLSKTLLLYILSWPFRVFSLLIVITLFTTEFYLLYLGLAVQGLHWGFQILITLIASQIILALMRHGYLQMIKKFSPQKLKSPAEHAYELLHYIVDIFTIALTLINTLLIVNAKTTFSYTYNAERSFNYLKHISKLLHKSILDLIKLFYIQIFFSLFPWRYQYDRENVMKEKDKILELTVLLTLLFWLTVLDIVFIAVFGLYCGLLHPRRKLYRIRLSASREKWKVTLKFLISSLKELAQVFLLVCCLPFRYMYAKQALELVIASENDYSFSYWYETVLVILLSFLTVPSILCRFILFLSIYKFKKHRRYQPGAQAAEKLFQNNAHEAAPAGALQNKNSINSELSAAIIKSEMEIFSFFGSLVTEIPFLLLVPICYLGKIWNLKFLKFVVDKNHDVRKYLIIGYLLKNFKDYCCFVPFVLTSLVLSFYNPKQAASIIRTKLSNRKNQLSNLPKSNDEVTSKSLEFFEATSAIIPKIFKETVKQLKKDLLFLPLFILSKLTLTSFMGCNEPCESVELFEKLLRLFYIMRVKNSGYYQEYEDILKIDSAAGMVKSERQLLHFWGFAYKCVRHRKLHKVICFILPRKISNRAIAKSKIENNFSAISNHYWYKWNITVSLLKHSLFFFIEVIVSLFGILFMLPLTLWRVPTFFILLKTHKFNKKFFFPILFKMYKQLFLDIWYLPLKLISIILFPRTTFQFVGQTCFRYSLEGVKEFSMIQRLKIQFIKNKILFDGFVLYVLLWKIAFVKLFWIRKLNLNNELEGNGIKLRVYFKMFITTTQYIPTVHELLKGESQEIKQEDLKIADVNELGLKISRIVDRYVRQTIKDIPYLFLMMFLLGTLPWRIYYIKQALLLMRNDINRRREMISLLKLISKDYQCIFLYFLLSISIVKTKRAFILFYRNAKINFYVGTLKYSHLSELRGELKEAANFYYSLLILSLSCFLAPYRISEIASETYNYYKNYKHTKESAKKNEIMIENTIKEGKSLQLLTTIGHSSLLQVLSFLDTRECMQMTRVSKYLYEVTKEKNDVWAGQWERAYAEKYPNFTIVNDGETSYNSMCIQKYQEEHIGIDSNPKNKFYRFSAYQINISAFLTQLNIKQICHNKLSPVKFDKLFTDLAYSIFEGYGPEDQWPQDDDEEEEIAVRQLIRREIVQLSEENAFVSWLFHRPTEFFIIRLNRFYGIDTHRRKKQLVYVISSFSAIIICLLIIWNSWSWFWTVDSFIGYRLLLLTYLVAFGSLFFSRYQSQSMVYITLHPFNLVYDVIDMFVELGKWLKKIGGQFKIFVVGRYIWLKHKFYLYVKRPVKWGYLKLSKLVKKVFKKSVEIANLFFEKVAKPLYISISDKLVQLWEVLKLVFKSLLSAIKAIFNAFRSLVKSIFTFFFSVVKEISKLYSNLLEQSLRLALSKGTVGELVFTIIVILIMFCPSLLCYFTYHERWFIIFSTLMTMVLIVTGYKHLNRIKNRIVEGRIG